MSGTVNNHSDLILDGVALLLVFFGFLLFLVIPLSLILMIIEAVLMEIF